MNSFGRIFRVSIFGESHGECVGINIDGCPAGLPLDLDDFSIDTVQTPNLPNTPMPANVQPIVSNQAQAVDQNTNLTSTEMALLSPQEQLIRQRLRKV